MNKGLTDFRLHWKAIVPMDKTPGYKIAGRFSHSAVVHESSMFIFGGGSSTNTTTFNDLWRFDLSNRKWIRPLSTGSYPSPKACASMVCYGNNLILFGGWRYPSLYPLYQPWRLLFDELHTYNINENRWTSQNPPFGPPPMAGHSATIHQNKMIVFGGYQINNEINSNSNEIWCLNLNTFTWSKPDISNTKPPPRYGQFQIALDSDNLLIVGGCGGPNNMFNDVWVLNMSGDVWQWRNILVKNRKWAATHMWCNPACRIGSKLVVLGPTPSLPTDFQILKQQMPQSANRIRRELPREENLPWNRNPNVLADDLRDHRDNLPNRPNNHRNVEIRNNQNNENPRNIIQQNINNRNVNEDEAASRLQRNLALRARDEDLNLPKRFNEPFEVSYNYNQFFIKNQLIFLFVNHRTGFVWLLLMFKTML